MELQVRRAALRQLPLLPAEPTPVRVPDFDCMDARPMAAAIAASEESIRRTLRAGHPVSCSSSFGKDSTLLCSLVLDVARGLREAGFEVPPIHVVNVDTLIENPEITSLRRRMMDHIREFADRHDLQVSCDVLSPNLTEQWWVRIIGGRKLPSYQGGEARCSVDMKVNPITRHGKRLQRRYADGKTLVTMIGTRFDESAERGRAMAERGESALDPVWMDTPAGRRLMLSPIAHWKTEQVFAYLQNVGQGRRYPGFAPDFSETLRIYSDSAGAGCMIEVDPSSTARGKGCGSRTGCSTCCRVSEDRSMKNLLLSPEYRYLRDTAKLRDFLMAIRWDFSRREWLGSRWDPETGAVEWWPNNFSAATCEQLLRMVLTIDRRELLRAEKHRLEMESGRIADTPWNRRMCEPQFQNLDLPMLVAIDYYWSVYALNRPFQVFRILQEVTDGQEMDIPSIEAVPRPERLPPKMHIPGDPSKLSRLVGSFDPTHAMVGEQCPDREELDATFTVDPEGAELFYQLELPRLLEQYAINTPGLQQAAARYYLQMGIVSYAKGRLGDAHRAMQVGQHRIHNDLFAPDVASRARPGAAHKPREPEPELEGMSI